MRLQSNLTLWARAILFLGQLFVCSALIASCSSGRVLADLDGARQLRRDAEEFERRGELDAALELYLSCLDRCPGVARINGSDLRRLAASNPRLEASVWDRVTTIESRVVAATELTEALRADVVAVVSVYRAWGSGARASTLLEHMTSAGSSSAVYEVVLAGCAAELGEDLKISGTDAEILARQLTSELEQRELMKADGAASAEWERVRRKTFVAYAAAMLASGHRERASSAASEQIGKDTAGCDELLDAATSLEAQPVVALLCEACTSESRCEK